MRHFAAGTAIRALVVLGCLAFGLRPRAAAGPDVVIHEIHYHAPGGDSRAEFVELRNVGTDSAVLQGWSIRGGIRLPIEGPRVLAPGEFLLLVADVERFRALPGGTSRVLGPWEGRLGNSGEALVLHDADGQEVDRVEYAEDGDWSVRMRGPNDGGHRGLVWSPAHDGGGSSLELIQPGLPNHHGQNWAASREPGGSPGRTNTVADDDIAPLIVDVRPSPWVPKPGETVTITAELIDESEGIRAVVHHRDDGETAFVAVPMRDDGTEGDRVAADGRYSARLPGRHQGTVVEWYVEATDRLGQSRTWPAPVQEDDAPRQTANALYGVDVDPRPVGEDARFRLVAKAADWNELRQINRNSPPAPYPTVNQTTSHAQFNATLIVTRGDRIEGRLRAGMRNRGNGSRVARPQSFRIQWPSERRWEGVRAMNLNSQVPDLQLLGSALMRRAGLEAALSRPVEVRFGTEDPTSPAYPNLGFYVANEVIDSDFARRQFPHDAGGAIYRGQRQDFPVRQHANLDYLGEDPTPYRALYFKRTGVAEDDWTDLIELTRVLNAPEATYADGVREVVDVDQWVRYFAANTLLDNQETSPVNGQGDDYFLLRGERDRRFRLLPYDLDTLLGGGFPTGSPTQPLYQLVGGRVPAFERFLTHPEFAPLFFREVRRLASTVWAPGDFDGMVDRVLRGRIPDVRLEALKRFHAERMRFALDSIPTQLSVEPRLSREGDRYRATTEHLSLEGVADPTVTREVRVQETAATWTAWTTRWRLDGIRLEPGENRILVRALDAEGRELAQRRVDVIWGESVPRPVSGTLVGSNVWSQGEGPYQLSGVVRVPRGSTLRLEPGTCVQALPGSALEIEGHLEAWGTPLRRIRFSASPEAPNPTNSWGGIRWAGVPPAGPHRLICTDVEHAGSGGTTLRAVDSAIVLDRCTFAGTTRAVLELERSSFDVRGCVFPSVVGSEIVHGAGIPEGGSAVLAGNVFGDTTAGNDVVDFTGARRPGPILEVRDNLFTGSRDDVLDLDGCDAHVEGNVFLHVTNGDPAQVNTSSAISFGAAGGYAPHVVVVRNHFYDVDHLALCKEGGFLTFEHNTAVRMRDSGINFQEPGRGVLPGRGAHLEGNLLIDAPRVFENRDVPGGTLEVTTRGNVSFGIPGNDLGTGNRTDDPLLENPVPSSPTLAAVRAGFGLQPGSPVRGWGHGGTDPGADVPAGATVDGIRRPRDWRTSVSAEVRGPGLIAFRWKMDGGPWSSVEQRVGESLRFDDLTPGPHRLEIEGKDSAGRWQGSGEVRVFEWIVDPGMAGVRLNEVGALAGGGVPPFVELWNDSDRPVDLGGGSIRSTGDRGAISPFPPGTILEPGAFRVIPILSLPGGGGVSLRDGRGELVDAMTFGVPVAGRSLGRWDEGWKLADPTPGTENRRAATGKVEALRINEWSANGRYLADADYVELFNPLGIPVALDGLYLTDNGVGDPRRSPFPPSSFVGAGSTALWIADGRPGSGPLGFRLSADGGDLVLIDASGRWLDSVQYLPQPEDVSEGRLPSGAVGTGRLRHPTPGGPNPGSTSPRIRFHELLVSAPSEAGAGAWVEFANDSDSEIDLGGLELVSEGAETQRIRIPVASVIPARGYRVQTLAGLNLGSEGGRLLLFDVGSNGGTLLDGIRFGPQIPDRSLVRTDPGSGTWRLGIPTPGAPNQAVPLGDPSRLRINEWMASPVSGEDWVELFNGGPQPVEVSGMRFSDDPDDPAKYRFPPSSYVGSGDDGYRLMTAAEPLTRPGFLGFGLRREGESIVWSMPTGRVVDSVTFGPQIAGVSEGRWPDGEADRFLFPGRATPGRTNQRPSETDRDGDGLDDAWERLHGLDPERASGGDGRWGDPDADGARNVEEWMAGTHPNDAASRLQFRVARDGEGIRVRFEQRPGRRYALEQRRLEGGGPWEVRLEWPDLEVIGETAATLLPTDPGGWLWRLRVENR